MRYLKRLLTGLLLVGAIAGPCYAQGGGGSEITNKQEQARLRFDELHQSMQRLQSVLVKTEPERAKLLSSANRYVQEQAIAADMKAVRDLLEQEDWDLALEKMTAVREELSRLLDLLLDRDLDMQRLMDEIKQLEKFRDRVDDLIAEEQKHKEASARAEALKKHLENLKKAQEELDAVIAEQMALRQEAGEAGLQAAANQAEAMAKAQDGLEQRTEDLAADIKDLEQEARDLAEEAAAAKDAEAKDGNPSDAKPSNSKPNDSKPSDSKPSDAKPSDAKPSEGEPKDGSPSEAKPGKSCKSCQSAAQSMGDAKRELSQNLPENSLDDMDAAMRKLAAAKKELEKMAEEAQRELQQLPFETLAREQERTKVDTDLLAKEMEEASKTEDGEEKKPTPGQKNVQQAVPKMRSAAGQLKEYKPSKAKQDQQDAKQDLEEAKQALEDALAQLRQELQDEVLRALEERFAAMLEAQKELSARTEVTDKLRAEALTADGSLPAAMQQRCVEIGRGEMNLASEAGDALKLLEEEGSTAVFPEIVRELKGDLMTVASRLQAHKTGRATRGMQADIEETLKTLLNSLRRAIEDSEGGGCGT